MAKKEIPESEKVLKGIVFAPSNAEALKVAEDLAGKTGTEVTVLDGKTGELVGYTSGEAVPSSSRKSFVQGSRVSNTRWNEIVGHTNFRGDKLH